MEKIIINVKYKNAVFAFLMAFCMSCFISFILISVKNGYDHNFLPAWLRTWSQAFVCAFFGAYFFPKVIHQIMEKINFVEKSVLIKKEILVKEQNNRSST